MSHEELMKAVNAGLEIRSHYRELIRAAKALLVSPASTESRLHEDLALLLLGANENIIGPTAVLEQFAQRVKLRATKNRQERKRRSRKPKVYYSDNADLDSEEESMDGD